MRLLLFIASFLLSSAAFAAGPTVNSASGASGFEGATASNAVVTVYGGLGGEACSNADNTPCNNCVTSLLLCATAPLCVCNSSRIYDGGTLRLNLTRPTGVTGVAKLVKTDTGAVPLSMLSTNDGTYIDFDWETLCQASDQATTCAAIAASYTTANLSTYVFIDKNADNQLSSDEEKTQINFKLLAPDPTNYSVYGAPNAEGIGGVQGFIPYPGDEKVFITDIDGSATPPTFTYGGTARTLRVFYSENGMNNTTVEASSKDITIETDGSLGKNTVTGLTNDTSYTFRIALLDQASNVVQFFPDTTTDAAVCNAGAPFTGCRWAATPEKVLGLFNEDINCFIATAAYGSSFENKVQTFRKFRNRYLLPNAWGRKFVKAYYDYGPSASRVIAERPALRALARAFLWPVYLLSALSLQTHPLVALLTLLSALSLIAFMIVRTRSYFAKA